MTLYSRAPRGSAATSPGWRSPPAVVRRPRRRRPPPAEPDPWPEFARALEDYFRANPFFAVRPAGTSSRRADARSERRGHRPRGRPYCAARRARGLDGEAMTLPERFEREHLYTVIDTDLFWLDRARLPFTNPAWYIETAGSGRLPQPALTRPWRSAWKATSADARYRSRDCRRHPRANPDDPLPQSFVARGIGAFGGFGVFYRKQVARSSPASGIQRGAAGAGRGRCRRRQGDGGAEGLARGSAGMNRKVSPWARPLFLEMLKVTERVDVPLSQLLQLGRGGP